MPEMSKRKHKHEWSGWFKGIYSVPFRVCVDGNCREMDFHQHRYDDMGRRLCCDLEPGARPHPEQGGPQWTDETGWLIEQHGLCLGLNCGKPAWVTFTNERAIRFARQQDGENFLTAIRAMKFGDSFNSCEVREHRWSGPVAQPSASPAGEKK